MKSYIAPVMFLIVMGVVTTMVAKELSQFNTLVMKELIKASK